LEALVSHASVPENTATLEEQVACVHDYMRSEAAATMRELYAEPRMDEDFVERACIQKACRGLSSTQISAVQARLREGEEVPARSAFTIEAWERGEFREAEEEAMNDRAGEKTMTVKEVAEALGVDDRTIQRIAKKRYPELVKNGVTTFLNEEQATAIKSEISKGQTGLDNVVEVGNIRTALDIERMTLQVIEYHRDRIKELETENRRRQERLAIAEPKAEYHDCGLSSKVGIARQVSHHYKSLYYIELYTFSLLIYANQESEKARKTHTNCHKTANFT
jgi:hypothetical protein